MKYISLSFLVLAAILAYVQLLIVIEANDQLEKRIIVIERYLPHCCEGK